LASLTTAEVRYGLGTAQIVTLSTADIVALTTAQIAAMSTAQIDAMTTAQLAAMTTNQTLHGLTAAQIHSLTTAQFVVMTFEQARKAALPASVQTVRKATLREKVGGLVQAMAAFDAQTAARVGAGSHASNLPSRAADGNLAIATRLVSMVDAMRQFDANGNVAGRSGEAFAASLLQRASALR